MSKYRNGDISKLAKDLQESVRRKIYEDILEQALEDFKSEVGPVIKAHAEKVVVSSIEQYMNVVKGEVEANVRLWWEE